jgi:hypothetical protein
MPSVCIVRENLSLKPKVEEKSSTTFSFSLSPGFLSFLSFLREKFPPFLHGKFHRKEQNTFSFSGFSQFSQRKVFSFLLHLAKTTTPRNFSICTFRQTVLTLNPKLKSLLRPYSRTSSLQTIKYSSVCTTRRAVLTLNPKPRAFSVCTIGQQSPNHKSLNFIGLHNQESCPDPEP